MAKDRSFLEVLGYGLRVVPFLCLLTLIGSLPVFADSSSILSDAVMRAKDMRLYDDPYWRTLLHYKPTLFGGYTSLVDDPKFFFASDGKENPESELVATLGAFFSPKVEGVQHSTSRFPGRYAWLREKLGLMPSDFPYDGDVEYQTVKSKINLNSIYLVFPSGYMKNPASMFGHTFLLIEAEGSSRLLAHSVNYGAVTTDTLGPVYAFKGLIGAYKGYYSFLPYYQKIQEYGDIDMRDMWEYKLKFSPEEADRLLRHVIEMGQIYSDYYFISENCSYNLLFLIEAAKPETKITDAFGPVVEPIETLKIIRKIGLSEEPTYRPSLYTNIEYLSSLLTGAERAYVKDVCFGRKTVADFKFTDAADETKTAIWELSSDYLKFLLSDGKISQADYRKRVIMVLSARKDLGSVDVLTGLVPPVPPHDAHGSSRVDITGGNNGDGFYAELGYRVTAHETMDIDPGYTKNSQLVFGHVAARYEIEEKKYSLRMLDLIDIMSLPSSDILFKNVCFNFRTGLEMNQCGEDSESLAARVKIAPGLSVSPTDWMQAYALAGVDSFFSPEYDCGTDLLAGGEVGLITSAGLWKGRLSASLQKTFFASLHTRAALSAEERIALNRDFSVSGNYTWKRDYNVNSNELSVALHFFF